MTYLNSNYFYKVLQSKSKQKINMHRILRKCIFSLFLSQIKPKVSTSKGSQVGLNFIRWDVLQDIRFTLNFLSNSKIITVPFTTRFFFLPFSSVMKHFHLSVTQLYFRISRKKKKRNGKEVNGHFQYTK